MRKILLSLFVTTFAGFCFAPIQLHDQPENARRLPAATEGDLQRQQGNQKVMGEVGSVPLQTEDHTAPSATNDPGASGVLGQAQDRLDHNDPKAQQVLQAAEKQLEQEKQGPMPMVFMGGLFLLVGFGVVFGFRQWANKAVPEMPDVAKKVSW